MSKRQTAEESGDNSKIRFARNYSACMTKAGFPEEHGRFSKYVEAMGANINTVRNRVVFGIKPKRTEDLLSEITAMIERIYEFHEERYDATKILRWMTLDGEPDPFSVQVGYEVDIHDAVQSVVNSMFINRGMDPAGFEGGSELVNKLFKLAKCVVEENSEVSALKQLASNEPLKALFEDQLSKFLDNYEINVDGEKKFG